MPLISFGKLLHRWDAALLKDLAPNVLHLMKGTSNLLTISADLRPSPSLSLFSYEVCKIFWGFTIDTFISQCQYLVVYT